jgi:hypothetical protein
MTHEMLLNQIIADACPAQVMRKNSDNALVLAIHIELHCVEYMMLAVSLNENCEPDSELRYEILDWSYFGNKSSSQIIDSWMEVHDLRNDS